MNKEELLKKFLKDNDFIYCEESGGNYIDLNDTMELFIEGCSLKDVNIYIIENHGYYDYEFIQLVEGTVTLQLIKTIIHYHCPKRLVRI